MKTHIYKNNQAVAKAFARYLAKQITKSDIFHLALSGGSTPKILFEILAKDYADKIDWQKVHLYWGDERCVPFNHPESNFGMTEEKLLQHIDFPSPNIHRVIGQNAPSNEAIRYGEIINSYLPSKNDLPVFDLVILGMGSDGHTTSIFPHQMELMTDKNTCGVATHPESGQKRITLNGPVINNAKQIHFLVTGASKSPVVRQIFNKKRGYKKYPAAHIENAEWWMDEVAGKQV